MSGRLDKTFGWIPRLLGLVGPRATVSNATWDKIFKEVHLPQEAINTLCESSTAPMKCPTCPVEGDGLGGSGGRAVTRPPACLNPPPHSPLADECFIEIDLNHDGEVTMLDMLMHFNAERGGFIERLFMLMDTSRNGGIDFLEVRAGVREPVRKRQRPSACMCARGFCVRVREPASSRGRVLAQREGRGSTHATSSPPARRHLVLVLSLSLFRTVRGLLTPRPSPSPPTPLSNSSWSRSGTSAS